MMPSRLALGGSSSSPRCAAHTWLYTHGSPHRGILSHQVDSGPSASILAPLPESSQLLCTRRRPLPGPTPNRGGLPRGASPKRLNLVQAPVVQAVQRTRPRLPGTLQTLRQHRPPILFLFSAAFASPPLSFFVLTRCVHTGYYLVSGKSFDIFFL